MSTDGNDTPAPEELTIVGKPLNELTAKERLIVRHLNRMNEISDRDREQVQSLGSINSLLILEHSSGAAAKTAENRKLIQDAKNEALKRVLGPSDPESNDSTNAGAGE